MNDIASRSSGAGLETSPSSSESETDSAAAKPVTVTLAMTPNFGICKSMSPFKTVVYHDDGNITLYMPVYPKGVAPQAPCNCASSPGSNDDVDEMFEPPPFPNFAPYNDFYRMALAHIVLFTQRQLLTTASYDLDAQSRILHCILWYLREELDAHVPFFGNRTASQLRMALEREPSFQQAMLTIKADLDDPMALRTILHYLCSHPPNPPVVKSESNNQCSSGGDGKWCSSKSVHTSPRSSDPPITVALAVVSSGNHGDNTASNVPPYKVRTYRSQIEARTSDWQDLGLFISDRCREVWDTVDDTASLAGVVQAVISFVNDEQLATTPFFEGLTCAQLGTFLAQDAAFYAAVRHLVTISRSSGWQAFSAALRVVVNHLCQQRKTGQDPSRRVRFTPD